MGALDHWLNVLDIALKQGERRDAEKQAAREARREAKSNGSGGLQGRSFSGPAVPADPSCCLAKRRFAK